MQAASCKEELIDCEAGFFGKIEHCILNSEDNIEGFSGKGIDAE